MLIGFVGGAAIWIGVAGGVLTVAGLVVYGAWFVTHMQATVTARFRHRSLLQA